MYLKYTIFFCILSNCFSAISAGASRKQVLIQNLVNNF